jgi:hypothetical protein
MAKYRMYQDGASAPVARAEEEVMLAAVDRGLAPAQSGHAVGESGFTVPLRDFLNGYLPPSLRAVAGRVIAPDDQVSTEVGVLIVDSRYPLLSEDLDGFVVAMLHSVVAIIQVRCVLAGSAIEEMWKYALQTTELATQVEGYAGLGNEAIATCGFAYRAADGLDALEELYRREVKPDVAGFDLTILRLREDDQVSRGFPGVEFCRKTASPGGNRTEAVEIQVHFHLNPLSSFCRNLVSNAYRTLGFRNTTYDEVEGCFGEYPSWSSYLSACLERRRQMDQPETGEVVEERG